jgi:sigma-B regulation protein RsbU (phosphoserine phosphatase)
MTPAREVGGDFYDFFMTDDSRLALVIADVSGKGVPAALFMMVARTLIRREARSGREPNEVLERVNKTLCESNDACMFVTAFIGVYDVRTGVLRCSCAGHNPPIAIESGGGTKEVKCPPSLVLAIDEAARYSSFETAIEPGGGLLLYTDGVTEAFNAEKELFSAERLAAAVGFAGGDARSMIERVRDELRKFAAGEGQSDDITMLAFRRLK